MTKPTAYPLIVEGTPELDGAVAELRVDQEGIVRAEIRIAAPKRQAQPAALSG